MVLAGRLSVTYVQCRRFGKEVCVCVCVRLRGLICLAWSVYASQENSACRSGLKSTYFHLNRLWHIIRWLVRCPLALQTCFLLRISVPKMQCGVAVEQCHHLRHSRHGRGMKCGLACRSHWCDWTVTCVTCLWCAQWLPGKSSHLVCYWCHSSCKYCFYHKLSWYLSSYSYVVGHFITWSS